MTTWYGIVLYTTIIKLGTIDAIKFVLHFQTLLAILYLIVVFFLVGFFLFNRDLSFRKGDVIHLRRRIDLNWFLGELNNREGAFPANHVQVLVPLPVPQCKALYDFRMGPNEEEGCLTFKKGAIINVFRRVDQNWAEGRIGDCIGIFPIAFVEMNSLAKQLMDVSAK